MKIEVKYDYQKEIKGKSKAPKSIRNALVSGLVLLLLIFVAGAGYIFYIDNHSKAAVIEAPKVDTTQQYHTIVPSIPDPNAPVGAAVELITSPVVRGSIASATIKTYPGATCSIKVMYNNVASTEAGLGNKVADSYGVVSWNWTLSSDVPLGSWPVDVSCSHHFKSGYVQGFVLVTAS